MRKKTPKPPSQGEEAFALHCRAEKLTPEREYEFAERRRYRFDFAFPDVKLGVEIEGGVWSAGRHTRGAGFIADCRKYNLAVFLGWRVLRYSTDMVLAGDAIADVLEILGREAPRCSEEP